MKAKLFRVPEPAAKDFEVLCAILGISERQAGEVALRDWVRKNRAQVSLEVWTEHRGSIAPMNRSLIAVQVTILKAELKQILTDLEVMKAEYQLDTFRKLQKMLPTAHSLAEETGDKELREILTIVASRVTCAPPSEGTE